MSTRVLVIPEDPTNNGYILKPVVEMVMTQVGRPRAKVNVLGRPRLRGYDNAMRAIQDKLPSSYGHMDLWLFMPDADRATPAAMHDLEDRLASEDVTLLCCPAQPEVEIYACSAYLSDLGISWQDAKNHPSFKEDVFAPLLKAHSNRGPGGGRRQMTSASLANRKSFFTLHPEIAELRDRIQAKLPSFG